MILKRIILNGKKSFTIFRTLERNQSTSKSKQTYSSLDYCANLVKKLDHENFMCTLLLPKSLRATAFAIRAFNIEISKIQENVTEPHIGPMRIKFWDECIDDIFKGKPVNHPILNEIYYATKRHKLSKIYFKRLIASRSKQLNSSSFPTILDMEKYADQTTTPVYMLLLEASNVKNIHCDHAASHFGKAQGLTNLIRALPHNIQDRLVFLPQVDLARSGISEESIFRGSFNPAQLNDVIYSIACMANNHLRMAYSLEENIPKEHRAIFLPSVSTRLFLQKLQKYRFDVFDNDVQKKSVTLPWWLLLHRFFKVLRYYNEKEW